MAATWGDKEPLITESSGGLSHTALEGNIEELLIDAESDLQALRGRTNMSQAEGDSLEKSSTESLSKARKFLSSLKKSIREGQVPAREMKEVERKARQFDQQVSSLSHQLEDVSIRRRRQDLMGAAKKKELVVEQATSVLDNTKRVQKESVDTVQRSLQLVDNMQTMGAETTVQMKQQTEQLRNIYTELKTMDSELDRANKLVRQFIRRAMTDKIAL
mmetsp:Transcript_38440/g.83274  ORF Transcript_38440/g.83274 Transcript_38440/m.83274 type:complete len:217 (+) Transcript_38440:1-651(+)